MHSPVIYQIVQELLTFTTRFLRQDHEQLRNGERTLVEKAKVLIESELLGCPMEFLDMC